MLGYILFASKDTVYEAADAIYREMSLKGGAVPTLV